MEIRENSFSSQNQNWDFLMYLQVQRNSPEKLTLTVVEMQHLPDIEKTDYIEEFSCLKRTMFNGRKKVCANFQTYMDKPNFDVYRYRNSLYLKDDAIDLNMTEHQLLLAKRFFLFSYFDIFYDRCIVLDETTIHK